MNKKQLLLFLILLLSTQYVHCKREKLSPISYGLRDCISDIQRYYVLQDLHNDAVRLRCDVDYSGIDSINIEIPRDAKSLPLGDFTDFGGVVLNVKNMTKRFQLFKMIDKVESLDMRWDQIQKGILPNDGKDYLLIIEDQEPWVKQRIGYKYGHTRRDVLLVKDGKAQNQVVSSYGTKVSRPKFSVSSLQKVSKMVKNLTLNRDTTSTFLTEILRIENQNDVEISNIIIHTPQSNMYGDAAIQICNCTNIKFNNIVIDGTYSQLKQYGYGISMNNVWNVSFQNLKANGNWGVFGNNNVNTVTMENSDINRFDIHCYGKDIRFKNCTFRNLYNQFSSVFGTVSFDNCTFLDFVPVLLESSYNAYTGFNLTFKDCKWKIRKDCNYLINVGNPFDSDNERPELKEKCWPNLTIKQMTIIDPKETGEIFLFGLGKKNVKSPVKIGHINKIDVKHVKILSHDSLKKAKLKLVNRPIGFKNAIVGLSDIIND